MTQLMNYQEASILDISKTKDWQALINAMPPLPNDFHVTGDVLVPNLGVKAYLTPREPQGINQKILLPNLVLVQQPGVWPQILTWTEARYDKVVCNNPYHQVQVFSSDTPIAEVPVVIVE